MQAEAEGTLQIQKCFMTYINIRSRASGPRGKIVTQNRRSSIPPTSTWDRAWPQHHEDKVKFHNILALEYGKIRRIRVTTRSGAQKVTDPPQHPGH